MRAWRPVLVWSVWTVATIHVLFQVHRYAVDLPFSDDFAFIARITGAEPMTLGWLYETHNEHRMVLPKLILVLSTRITGCDFRAVPYVSVLLLAAAAAVAILAIARVRTRVSAFDALIPVTLCCWAQADALVWSSPLNLVSSTAHFVGWWGASVWARSSDWRVWPTVVTATLSFAVLLVGGSGIAAMCGVVPWLVWAALDAHGKGRRAAAMTLVVATLADIAYAIGYVAAYSRPEGHPEMARLSYTLRYAIRLVASPFTMEQGIAEAVGVGICVVLAILVIAYVRGTRRFDERTSATALLVGTMAVCAAVAVGRAGFGTLTVAPRYVTLMTPLVVAMLVLADRLPGLARSHLLAVVAAITVVSMPTGDKLGHSSARAVHQRLAAARKALVEGEASESVNARFELYPDSAYGTVGLEQLRAVKGSVFREL